MLEFVKKKKIKKFIYASSSSVYGGNKKLPFSVEDRVDQPVSLYAASKKSSELISECYSKLFGFQCIGLRFFTVYGPWGRPDMATFIFTKNIINKKKIKVFNFGKMKRDFTYIDDIIQGIEGAITSKKRNTIYNLGNNNSENLMDFIKIIEENLGLRQRKHYNQEMFLKHLQISKQVKGTSIFHLKPKFLLEYQNLFNGSKNFII